MANQMIALGVNPPQPINMLKSATDVAALGSLMQDVQGARGVQEAIAGGMAPSDPRLLQYGKRGQATYSAALEGRAAELDMAGKKADLIGSAANFVLNNPTPENFSSAVSNLVRLGVYTPQEGQEALAEVQANPSRIRLIAEQQARQALSVKDQLMQMYSQDVGGAVQVMGVDPLTGQPKVLSRTGKSLTPGQRLEQQQLQTAQQNQNIVNAMLSGQSAAAAPSAAPVNALTMPPGAGAENQQAQLRNQIAQLRMAGARGNPQASAAADELEKLVTPKGAGATPASIQEYNLAVGQGFSGTFQDYQRENAALRNWSQPMYLTRISPQTGESETGYYSYNSVTNETKPIGQTPLVGTVEVGAITPTSAPTSVDAAPTVTEEKLPSVDSLSTPLSQTPLFTKPFKGEKVTEDERKGAAALQRVLSAADQIAGVTAATPSAAAPGALETAAAVFPLWDSASSELQNWARPVDRQIVAAAQRDMIDALLFLATGAAYNKEQLQGQMDSYLPKYTDKSKKVLDAKRQRLIELIQGAKARAGGAWTPELDAKVQNLIATSFPGAGGAGGAGDVPPPPEGVDDEVKRLWQFMTPEERKAWQQ